jgi:uncharacterized alpha/beta hydrolase family protein
LPVLHHIDPQNPLSEVILDTNFANDDYWANNFNDMMSAMNVIFNLLVVNNWYVSLGASGHTRYRPCYALTPTTILLL